MSVFIRSENNSMLTYDMLFNPIQNGRYEHLEGVKVSVNQSSFHRLEFVSEACLISSSLLYQAEAMPTLLMWILNSVLSEALISHWVVKYSNIIPGWRFVFPLACKPVGAFGFVCPLFWKVWEYH